MNNTSAWSNEEDSQFDRIDGVCDNFEIAWNAGSRPRIEVFLGEVAEADRSALFRELLSLELHYRRAAGEIPTSDEYWHRFPEHEEVISSAFTLPVRPGNPSSVEDGESSRRLTPTVPGYEIQGELGRGGMGVVYRAHHAKLNRPVALKMILNGAHVSPEGFARFRNEAQAMARLPHPHIVQIYEIGEADDLPYFAMEFVGGGSLANRLNGLPQPPLYSARLVELLARAVADAHKSEIVHRDLKPANILFSANGEPKIADFGLAKMTDADHTITAPGMVMGTPAYMAPEQARGDANKVGPSADIYTLGVILFELLIGRVPFKAETTVALLRKVESEPPPSLRKLCPGVPRDLEAICFKCLEKNPADRYPSAAALADDLASYQEGKPLPRPLIRVGRAWRRCRRNPAVAGMSFLACLAIFAALGFAILTADDSLSVVKRAGKLRIGIDPDGAPFAIKVGGRLTGIDVELAENVAGRLGVKAEFVEMKWNWPEMVNQLGRRNLDVLMSVITITEERKSQVAFVEYARDPLVFTGKQGSLIRTRQDLAGKTVAVQAGTTAEETAKRLERGVGFKKIVAYPNTFEPFDAVRDGIADITLDHKMIARYACRDGKLEVLSLVGQELDPEPLGIALRKDARALREAIAAAVAAMKADGDYGRMLEGGAGR